MNTNGKWMIGLSGLVLIVVFVTTGALVKCRGPAPEDSPITAMATATADPGRAVWWRHPDGSLGVATRVYTEGEDNPRWTLWDECELRVGGVVAATLVYSKTFAAEELPRAVGTGMFLDTPDLWWDETPPGGAETWCRCRWTSTDGEEEIGFAYRDDWTLGPRDEQGFYLVHVYLMYMHYFPFVGQGGKSP